MTIETIVQKYPKLGFLQSPKFAALPEEKKKFLLGCVEDALFWIDLEEKPESGKPQVTDGFKFLTAAVGLLRAQHEADDKRLQGPEREKFLTPHEDLYTQFCPHFGTDSPAC